MSSTSTCCVTDPVQLGLFYKHLCYQGMPSEKSVFLLYIVQKRPGPSHREGESFSHPDGCQGCHGVQCEFPCFRLISLYCVRFLHGFWRFPLLHQSQPSGSDEGVRFPASFTWQTDSLSPVALRGDHSLAVKLLELLIGMLFDGHALSTTGLGLSCQHEFIYVYRIMKHLYLSI